MLPAVQSDISFFGRQGVPKYSAYMCCHPLQELKCNMEEDYGNQKRLYIYAEGKEQNAPHLAP
jgi:hypothetical protein